MNPRVRTTIDRWLEAGDVSERAWLEHLVRSGACRSAGLARRANSASPWTLRAELDPRRELHDPNALQPEPAGPLPTALPCERLLVLVPGRAGDVLLQLAGWDPTALSEDELASLLVLFEVVAFGRDAVAPLPDPERAPGGESASELGALWEALGAELDRGDRLRWRRATQDPRADR